MILYRNTAGGFIQDVKNNLIAEKIEEAFFEHCINHNNDAEYRSWANSMQYMRNILDDRSIPQDCRIAIEYQIPLTSKRIDFLIAGEDQQQQDNVVVVELKQWESSEQTSAPDIVKTYTGGAIRTVTHPCYQAHSYAQIIEDFNAGVRTNDIHIIPCAYLHNYKEEFRSNIDNDFYRDAIESAPIFLSRDGSKLREFVAKYIHKRSGRDLLMQIENGKLKPSKSLQDTLGSMLKGNKEFYLIDEQKVAYEAVKGLVTKQLRQSRGSEEKATVIIQGGPGTGKSVIAIQLLADLIALDYSALYVTKNAAPRNVYFARLKRDNYRLGYIKSLFAGSGSFVETKPNTFDCLLADEAHRLQMKSGMYHNLGESQVREIIRAARVSVFLIDEEQQVTTQDVCTRKMIRQYAMLEGSHVYEGSDLDLVSQFRCNGSDGYLSFLNSLLEMKASPNVALGLDYDIRVFDDPDEMREALRVKNMINNRSRLLAGYCYNWESKKDPMAMDICLKNGFRAQWNFADTSTWAIDEESFDQVGCIHTSQGLEFDYVGVIIGQDLIYKDGHVKTDYTKRAKTDTSLNGIRVMNNYELADKLIRNTYRTLLSRGQKGCYIYCEDQALSDHIKELLRDLRNLPQTKEDVQDIRPLILEEVPEEDKYIRFYPVYTIKAACGRFGYFEPVQALGWMAANGRTKDRSKYIVQAVGHSMEPKIHDGDYCLFSASTAGSREGKIVLAEQIGEVDQDYQGRHTIKMYHSEKTVNEDGSWQHESIVLKPLNKDFDNIVITADDAEDLRIVGEFIEVISSTKLSS